MPARGLGTGTKEAFSGKEQDAETGLDYFGARYYMPALGRWAAVDPQDDDSPEWSPYDYVRDNTAGQTDPDGRQPGPAYVYQTQAALQNFAQSTGVQAAVGFASGVGHWAEGFAAPVLHPIRTLQGVATLEAAGRGDVEAQMQLANGVGAAAREGVDQRNTGGTQGKVEVATEAILTLERCSCHLQMARKRPTSWGTR